MGDNVPDERANAERVATLERGVIGAEAVEASEFPAALVATTVNV
jgi:hypothetical protein